MKQTIQIKHNEVEDCQIVEANPFAIYKRVSRIQQTESPGRAW